jgi:hypothetical protein
MNTTSYVHLNNAKNLILGTQFIDTTQVHSITAYDEGEQLTMFLTSEQILQLHASLGKYIQENADKLVNKSITELEEVKND